MTQKLDQADLENGIAYLKNQCVLLRARALAEGHGAQAPLALTPNDVFANYNALYEETNRLAALFAPPTILASVVGPHAKPPIAAAAVVGGPSTQEWAKMNLTERVLFVKRANPNLDAMSWEAKAEIAAKVLEPAPSAGAAETLTQACLRFRRENPGYTPKVFSL